jgi:hypothetical protein
VVLDTSAFIAGFDPLSIRDDVYSVGSVEVELASLPVRCLGLGSKPLWKMGS